MPGRYIAAGLYSEVVVHRGSTVDSLFLTSSKLCITEKTMCRSTYSISSYAYG